MKKKINDNIQSEKVSVCEREKVRQRERERE